MSTQSKEKCPLCTEEMDLTDKQLKPCKCGYEICLYCWHQIMEMDQKEECGRRCPACRAIYNKDRIMGTGIGNQILNELCASKSNLQKEQTKSQKQKPVKVQSHVAEESLDLYSARVIQRKLVYIVGIPSEFASDKVLRQKNFLGQYGKIENIIIDNIGANQQIPDSGRVYVTFSREDEAIQCIEAVNGFLLDGRPLKATFGVTRYCRVWLSKKVCQKPICSYVHQKAPPEDICTKDDVAGFCARLLHLMGMDSKGLQQRSGNTLPPPGDGISRTAICNGNSKDKTCSSDCRVLPNDGNNNSGTLPAATQRDSSVPQEEIYHDRTPNNQQRMSASISQELPPLGLKGHHREQLASNGDKPQASVQSANNILNYKQVIAAGNGTVDALTKSQYVNVVSQGSSEPARRFTVLTRQMASTDTRSKATGQVGNVMSDSKKLTLANNEHSDSIKIPQCYNVKLASQRPEKPSHMLSKQLTKAIGESHAEVDEKNACSDVNKKPAQGIHIQLKENTAALQSLSDSPTTCNNLPSSDIKSQISDVPDKFSDPHRKSTFETQLLHHKKTAISFSDIANASDTDTCSIANNQVLSTDSKHQISAQGSHHNLYKGDRIQCQISSQHPESVFSPRPLSLLSSADIVAKNNRGIKKHVFPPGFQNLHRPSDSDKIVSVSSTTCPVLCSKPGALVQDSCSVTDQPDIISWVSECLEEGGDTTQSNSVSMPSALSSTDTTWRCMQYPSSGFSGASSNHSIVSPHPSSLLQHMDGVENTMNCGFTYPSISGIANQRPEYWNGSAHSHMSTRGYDALCQNTTPSMISGLSPQVDHPYPMYSLF
ncbi:hypothetical protein GUJ93_ZPchr0001g30399 [Zizania palustris]|uniref:CCR4-NOT transcription complex subunit 4 n=1 Tax=Zizania palustris TaxID=103762 RepID=A0A8J5RFY2_ZIZPA|nr:hypothetical protein GUJ93_ZPchr0001g30399 [Zizania palustris]